MSDADVKMPEPEPYPDGKALWFAVCETRKVPRDRAEGEWRYWEGEFMTQGEWQIAATIYARAAVLAERERCAKVCEDLYYSQGNAASGLTCAAAIRKGTP